MNQIRLIILALSIVSSICDQYSHQQEFNQFFEGCRKQLTQWVGFEQNTQQLIHQCDLQSHIQKIIILYKEWTQIDLSFNLKHFDLLRKYLKQDTSFRSALKCLIQTRKTENEYFNEQKKFKYFGKFVKQYPGQGNYLFIQQQNMWTEKGKKLCNFFKAFFQYYYLNVLRPSETQSTTFLRTLTVRSSIFNHEDIAYCVDLQTHGNLAENLDQLDINNIYIKIPEIFNAVRFIKLKKDCSTAKNIEMVKRVQQRLREINMFKIMYHDYEPFVEIAAERFGTSQLKRLAIKIADIIQNVQDYRKYWQEL